MTADALTTFEGTVRELEGLAKKRREPSRFHARDLLLALGELILDDRGTAADAGLSRLRKIRPDLDEGLGAAIAEELQLACTEHVQGVDPRYLDHARYDFDYTVAARQRLEMRFRAAEALDVDVDEQLLTQVAAADAILEPYLRRRRGETQGN